jgi:hypothetical protein
LSDKDGADLIITVINLGSFLTGMVFLARAGRVHRAIRAFAVVWLCFAFLVPIAIVLITRLVGESQDAESQWRAMMVIVWAFLAVITSGIGLIAWLLVWAGAEREVSARDRR